MRIPPLPSFPGALLSLILLTGLSSLFAQSPTVTLGSSAVTIHPGDTAVPVAVTLGASTLTEAFSITLQGLPSGITVAPLTLSPGGTGTLLLSATRAAGMELFPAVEADAADIAAVTVTVLAFDSSAQASTPLTLSVSLENPGYAPPAASINLPVLSINTSGVGIVDKTTDVPGTITITSADGRTSYLPSSTLTDNTATFHIHGNSTAMMPKKPYHVKLNTSADLLAAMGLSCGYVNSSGVATCDKSKSFILLANYDDKTLLRDWSASALANAIPSGGTYLAYAPGSPTPTGTSVLGWWAPHSLFVELYLNGQYEGSYQLIEEVKIDSHRINIDSIAETTTSGASLTGGYLVEIDAHQDEDFVFTTPQQVPMGLIDPDYVPEVPQQTAYISNYVDAAETALFSSTYTDPQLGWRAYFDEAAAVNFYIVNDLMGNVDGGAFFSSDFFYKSKSNPLLYMGPIWDFDISSGNVNYQPIVNPTVPWMQTEASWYARWFTDPGFKAAVVQQWNALKQGGVLSSWMASIPPMAATLEQTQANNFARWPMQEVRVWPNQVATGSYDAEVSYFTGWLSLREAYLDSLFNNKVATSTALTVPTGVLRSGTPVTLGAQVAHGSGSSAPSGTVTLLMNGAAIGSGSVSASGSASITTSLLASGSDVLEAVYSGDTTYALSASDATTATVLSPLQPSSTHLSTSIATGVVGSPATLSAIVISSAGSSQPTGTVTFVGNGTVLASAAVSAAGLATVTTTSLPSGTSTIVANYSGDLTYQSSPSNAVSLTLVLPPAPTPVFSLLSGTYTTAQNLTITGPLPGSTVFYTTDGSVPTINSNLYTGPLPIQTSQTVQAIAAAPNYAPSSIAAATYTIPPSFQLSLSAMNTTLSSSHPIVTTVTAAPVGGFQGTIALACGSLPAGATCTFAPATITTAGAPVSSSLSISLNQTALARPARHRFFGSPGDWAIRLGSALLLLPVGLRGRRSGLRRSILSVPSIRSVSSILSVPSILSLIGAVLLLTSITGCGSGSQGDSVATVIVNATSGSVSQSGALTIFMTP